MKSKIILLKIFSIFLILLQGCNNFKQEKNEERKEKSSKTFDFSEDLNEKYSFQKFYRLDSVERSSTAYLGVQPYKGSLLFGKVFNEKYNSFINRDIYKYSECALCDDILYVKIDNGDVIRHRSILLKIEKDQYKIIGTELSDISFDVFTPIESTLKISSDKFHVGDTIVGDIFLTCSSSREDYVMVNQIDGYFMGVIKQCTEEWKEMIYEHAGERW
jgi:hypothetical protein